MFGDESPVVVAEPLLGTAAQSLQSNAKRFRVPVGQPRSIDEALADIEEGEREFQRGDTFSHKKVMQMIWSKIDGYVGKV